MDSINQNYPQSFHSLPRRKVMMTFGGVLIAMFLGSLDQTIVATAMPRIIGDLGGFDRYTWVATVYIIAAAVTMPIVGKLTDMYGRKHFYIAGICIFVVTSLGCGLSNSMNQIILFRGLQGIGAGFMMANAFAVIGDLFPPAERGKYQGIISANFGVSSMIGPVLGGYITDTFSWHWIFFINIPLALLIILLFIRFFPYIKPDNLKHKVDYAGIICMVMTLVPIMIALALGGGTYAWNSPFIIGLFAFAVIMGFIFLKVEKRASEPIIPLQLFRNRIVSINVVAAFFTSFGMFGMITFVPLFFQGVLGLSATASGGYLTPMMMGTVFGSFIAGQVLSRCGGHYRYTGVTGIVLLAIGLGLVTTANGSTASGIVVTFITLFGFGLGITMPTFNIAVQNSVPYSYLGVATSFLAFFRSFGGSVSLAVFGVVLNSRFSRVFLENVSPELQNALSTETVTEMAYNPYALVNTETQSGLQALLAQASDQPAVLWEQLMTAMRMGLENSLTVIFLVSTTAAVLALAAYCFIKEIPLRKTH